MSETTQAAQSTLSIQATANPRRTTLASVAGFAELPGFTVGERSRGYATELPASTANPRRTKVMVAPAQRAPQD